MKKIVIATTILCLISSCCNPIKMNHTDHDQQIGLRRSEPVKTVDVYAVAQKIRELPNGAPIRASELITRLGLSRLNEEVKMTRKTNVLYMRISPDASMLLFSFGEPIAISRSDAGSLWETTISHLDIIRIELTVEEKKERLLKKSIWEVHE